MLLQLTLVLLAVTAAWAYEPIPRVQAVPLPYHQVSFQIEEREIARYHFGPELDRPFIFPVNGPSGRSLTRMGHPGDPAGHSHHNSVWLSLNDVNGVNFWADGSTGRIRHRSLDVLHDGNDSAYAVSQADWVDSSGKVVLREKRLTGVQVISLSEWMLLIDVAFTAPDAPATISQEAFGPIGVRMSKWIGVHPGGGTIRNSEDAVGEKAIFRKPARWVDYSGRSADRTVEGITLMDHPGNLRHPAVFHVREDGWMGAVHTQDSPYRIEAGETLRLRYALYVHRDMLTPTKIDSMWKRFAANEFLQIGPPKRTEECVHGGFRQFNTPQSFPTQKACEAFVTNKH